VWEVQYYDIRRCDRNCGYLEQGPYREVFEQRCGHMN